MPRPKHTAAYRARRQRMRQARHMRDVKRRLDAFAHSLQFLPLRELVNKAERGGS
jgi:hypothetical protein